MTDSQIIKALWMLAVSSAATICQVFSLLLLNSTFLILLASFVGMAAPWLLTVGFTITFGCLHIKLRRVNQLLRNAQRFQRTKVTATQVMAPLVRIES